MKTKGRVGRRTHDDRKAETRQKLIAATVQEINRRGVGQLRTRQISAAAGVSWGAVQHLYGDKSKLLIAVVEETCETIVAEKRQTYDLTQPLEYRIKWILQHAWETQERPDVHATWEILLSDYEVDDATLDRQVRAVEKLRKEMGQVYLQAFADLDLPEKKIIAVHDIISYTLMSLARFRRVRSRPSNVKRTLSSLHEIVYQYLSS